MFLFVYEQAAAQQCSRNSTVQRKRCKIEVQQRSYTEKRAFDSHECEVHCPKPGQFVYVHCVYGFGCMAPRNTVERSAREIASTSILIPFSSCNLIIYSILLT